MPKRPPASPELWTPPTPELWAPGDQPVVQLGRALVAAKKNPLLQALPPDGRQVAVYPQGGAFPPHALIVGSTRGGKTSALRYHTTGLIRLPGPKAIHLADGKFAGNFLMFTGQPGVVDVANSPDAIEAMVYGFREQVEERYADQTRSKLKSLISQERAAYQALPPQWMLLDEFFNWVLGLPEKRRGPVIDALVRIGSIGGEVDCRLWVATQRPDSSRAAEAGLPGRLKSLLLCRIAQTGLVGMHPLESRMAFGEDDSGAAGRMESVADRAGLEDRRGLGMVQIGRFEVVYKTPWMADPLDWRTSEDDVAAAWALLPGKLSPEAIAAAIAQLELLANAASRDEVSA